MNVTQKELRRIIREEVMLHEGIGQMQWWIEVLYDDGRSSAYGPFASEAEAANATEDSIVVSGDKTWEYTELPAGREPQADQVFNFDSLGEDAGEEEYQELEIEGAIKEAAEQLLSLRLHEGPGIDPFSMPDEEDEVADEQPERPQSAFAGHRGTGRRSKPGTGGVRRDSRPSTVGKKVVDDGMNNIEFFATYLAHFGPSTYSDLMAAHSKRKGVDTQGKKYRKGYGNRYFASQGFTRGTAIADHLWVKDADGRWTLTQDGEQYVRQDKFAEMDAYSPVG